METPVSFEHFDGAAREPGALPWAVYRATDTRTGQPARLSVFWAAEHATGERVQAGLDWFAEAGYQAQRLHSDTLPDVLAYKSTAEAAYVASTWPRGRPMKAILDSGERFSVERAMHVSSQVARTLAEAHAAGWAHGWLNSGTVWVAEDDHVTVTDLGLGLAAQPMAPAGVAPYAARSGFLAPDPLRRDMQCLGLLIAEMLAGPLPQPVGVPRAEVFPDGTPPRVVRQVRALVNAGDADALTAAEWVEFARVHDTPEADHVGHGGRAADTPDAAFYEIPARARWNAPNLKRWWPYLAGVLLFGILTASATWFFTRNDQPPGFPPNAGSGWANPNDVPDALKGNPAPSANAAPAPETLTRVQVGPIRPSEEERMVARLKRMGFLPYVKAEGENVYIQVGAFATPDSARATQDQLRRAGLPVRVQ